MAEPDTLVIQQAAWKIWLFLLMSIVFVAIGVMMVNDPDGSARRSAETIHFWGWASIAFFGLAALAFVARLIRPATLTLTSEGFEMRQLHRHDFYRWSSIREFHIFKVRSARLAAWRLHDHAPEFGVGARMSRSFGSDGSIGGGWNRSPEEIVALLQAWKERYAPG